MKGVAIPYSDAELDFIESRKTMTRSELTTAFNKHFDRDVSVKNIHALCKRKGWSTGRTGRFVKGQESWNKGIKGYMGANTTSFKKGQKAHNHKPVGSERVCPKDNFVVVKVAEPNQWKHKHVHIYEQIHGVCTKGEVVRFLDGDKRNFSKENLVLITRSENLILNRMNANSYSQELSPALLALARVQAKQGELKKLKRKR